LPYKDQILRRFGQFLEQLQNLNDKIKNPLMDIKLLWWIWVLVIGHW
jgi:hypothetical protein